MPAYSFSSPRPEPPYGEMASGLRPGLAVNEMPTPLDIHVHREAEVGVVLAGEEWIEFSDHRVVCRPGDVWLCAVGEPHGYAKAAGTAVVVLLIRPELIGEEMLGDLPWLTLFSVAPTQRPWVCSPETRQRVLRIASVLRTEIDEKRLGWHIAVRLEFLRLMLELETRLGIRSWSRRPPCRTTVGDLLTRDARTEPHPRAALAPGRGSRGRGRLRPEHLPLSPPLPARDGLAIRRVRPSGAPVLCCAATASH